MSMNPAICHQESSIQRIVIEVEVKFQQNLSNTLPENIAKLLISQTTNSEKCGGFHIGWFDTTRSQTEIQERR